jgi:hypothetical protein
VGEGDLCFYDKQQQIVQSSAQNKHWNALENLGLELAGSAGRSTRLEEKHGKKGKNLLGAHHSSHSQREAPHFCFASFEPPLSAFLVVHIF